MSLMYIAYPGSQISTGGGSLYAVPGLDSLVMRVLPDVVKVAVGAVRTTFRGLVRGSIERGNDRD